MGDERSAEERVRADFEYPVVNPMAVPVQVGENKLHVKGGPFSGPVLTLEDVEEEGIIGDLVGLVDGETHVDEVLAAFDDSNREEVARVIEGLHDADAIQDAAVFDDRGLYEHTVMKKGIQRNAEKDEPLDEQSVGVVNVGHVGEHVASTLLEMGVGEVTFAQPVDGLARDVGIDHAAFAEHDADVEAVVEHADFVVYTADRRCAEVEKRLNRHAYGTNTPWVTTQLLGYDGFVGPAVFPDVTPCFHCFRKRIQSHALDPDGFDAYWEHDHSRPESFERRHYPPLARTVAGLLCQDLVHLLRFGTGYLAGRVVWLNSVNLDMSADRVLKLPRCEVCGTDPAESHNPMVKRQDVADAVGLDDR